MNTMNIEKFKECGYLQQDPLGIQGRMVYNKNRVSIFRKPILPSSNGALSEAVAIMYRG